MSVNMEANTLLQYRTIGFYASSITPTVPNLPLEGTERRIPSPSPVTADKPYGNAIGRIFH